MFNPPAPFESDPHAPLQIDPLKTEQIDPYLGSNVFPSFSIVNLSPTERGLFVRLFQLPFKTAIHRAVVWALKFVCFCGKLFNSVTNWLSMDV